MTIYTVANASELASALSKATGGDRIELKPGSYGDFSMSGKNFASDVTITAQDPNNPPSFNTMTMIGCKNVKLDNIDFDFQPDANTVEWSNALRVDQSSGITVVNSTFTGGNAVVGADPNSPAGAQGSQGILGWPIGRGMSFLNSSDITIEDNVITGFSAGVRFSNVDDIEFNRNDISGFRKVPVGGGDVNNVHIEGNFLHDPNPWSFGGAGDHGDYIHFWTTSTQTGPSTNFVIKDNYMSQGDGTAILGIYLDDNTNNKGFTNVLIQNNVIHNGNGQAIRMEDVDGLQILSNTILGTLSNPNVVPQIQLENGTKNVLVDDNILSGITGAAMSNPAGNNITIGNNITVQITNPFAPNYAGNIFYNGLGTQPSLDDFMTIPGSVGHGFGANITPTKAVWGYIASSAGTGSNSDDVTLDATNLFNTSGKLNLTGAKIVWDFGDGTTGMGTKVTHDYDTFGAHNVTAQITLANGTKLTLTKTVNVLNPVPISEDFDDKAYQGAYQVGTVQLENDGSGGSAVRIIGSKSALKYNNTAAISKNDEFTISLDFKKDVGKEGLGGRAFYFGGTAVIDLGADSITLRGRTSTGDSIVLTAGGIGIKDANWHNITYSFSKADGTATLFIDGKAVDQVTGLTGSQYTTTGAGMHLGNPFGTTFSGLLDNLTFTADSIASTGPIGGSTGGSTSSTGRATTNTLSSSAVSVDDDIIVVDTAPKSDKTDGLTKSQSVLKMLADSIEFGDRPHKADLAEKFERMLERQEERQERLKEKAEKIALDHHDKDDVAAFMAHVDDHIVTRDSWIV
ncbi:MAG: hypothetical protein RLZZ528_2418 [Pseudomonadota bacterium]